MVAFCLNRDEIIWMVRFGLQESAAVQLHSGRERGKELSGWEGALKTLD